MHMQLGVLSLLTYLPMPIRPLGHRQSTAARQRARPLASLSHSLQL